jgi:hypothetical protein
VLNHLWGSTVNKYALDLEKHSFLMEVEVPQRDRASEWYALRFEGILSFHLDTAVRFANRAYLNEPWNYVELTTISASEETAENLRIWRVALEYWETNCTILCREFEVEALT